MFEKFRPRPDTTGDFQRKLGHGTGSVLGGEQRVARPIQRQVSGSAAMDRLPVDFL